MISDDFRFSLKLIINNKRKTLFNILLSFMMGLLVLFLLSIDISVKSNGDDIAESVFYEKDNIVIQSEVSSYYGIIRYNDNNFYETFEKFTPYYDYIDDYYSTLRYKSDSVGYPVYDVQFLLNKKRIELKYNNLNVDGDYVYISEEIAKKYSLDKNDTIEAPFTIDSKVKYEFYVADIFKDDGKINSNIIFDKAFLKNKNKNDVLGDLYAKPITINLNKNNDVKDTIRVTKELINIIETSNYDEITFIAFSTELNNYEYIMIVINIFFYVTLVFLLISIFLTVGVVSNSISMLLDVNKKSLGLFKALGMKNKDTVIIMMIEIIILFLLGFLLSVIVMYVSNGLLQMILDKIMNTLLFMFDKQMFDLNELSFKLNISFYIPVIMMFSLIIFVVLFSFKSIRKILYHNPIDLVKREE